MLPPPMLRNSMAIPKGEKNMKKATLTTRIRKYRIDKRHPKRPYIIIGEDLGDGEYIEKLTLPIVERTQTFIPKNPNPNLFWLWKHPIRIIWYLDTEKGFIFDSDKNFLESFEKHDLKKLYSRIGQLFRAEKKPKRISNLYNNILKKGRKNGK